MWARRFPWVALQRVKSSTWVSCLSESVSMGGSGALWLAESSYFDACLRAAGVDREGEACGSQKRVRVINRAATAWPSHVSKASHSVPIKASLPSAPAKRTACQLCSHLSLILIVTWTQKQHPVCYLASAKTLAAQKSEPCANFAVVFFCVCVFLWWTSEQAWT